MDPATLYIIMTLSTRQSWVLAAFPYHEGLRQCEVFKGAVANGYRKRYTGPGVRITAYCLNPYVSDAMDMLGMPSPPAPSRPADAGPTAETAARPQARTQAAN